MGDTREPAGAIRRSPCIVTRAAPSSPLPTACAALRLTARWKGSPRLQRWLGPPAPPPRSCQTWQSGAAMGAR